MIASGAYAVLETGLTAGMNFSSIDDMDVKETKASYDRATGYHIGLFLKGGLGPIGLRGGLVYMDAGPIFEGLSDVADVPDSFEDNFNVRYLTIPVDLQYKFLLPPIQPYLLAGPEFRINMTSNDDFDDNFKSMIVAANIGVGLDLGIPFLGLSLTPEFRYTFDLEDSIDETFMIGDVEFQTDDPPKGSMYQLRVHVGF